MCAAQGEPNEVECRIIFYSQQGKMPKEIHGITGYSVRNIQRIRAKWIDRWYKPAASQQEVSRATMTNGQPPATTQQTVDPAREFCQLYLTSTDERIRMKCLSELANLQIKNHYISETPLEVTPQWTRPDFLTPKQLEVIEVGYEGSMLLYGDRQTGKSTAWFIAAVELMITKGISWMFMGATGKSGRKIVGKLIRENPCVRPVLTDVTQIGFKTYNGATFEIKDATIADVKGQTAHVILDEFDQMLEHEDIRECLGRLLPVFRAIPNAHLWLIANRGGQIFEAVLDVFARYAIPVLILTGADAPQISRAGNDDFLHDMISTIAGEGVANQQLLNEALELEEAFPNASSCFGDPPYTPDPTDRARVVGVDPGFRHPTAIFVGAMDKFGIIHEICTIELHGESAGEEYILGKIESLAREYAAEIVCESNSGALHWGKRWRDRGLRVVQQNFGGPTVFASREGFCSVARGYIGTSKLRLHTQTLRNQMVMYDPDRNRNEAKGDSVDAMLHCIWRLHAHAQPGSFGGQPIQASYAQPDDEFCFGS